MTGINHTIFILKLMHFLRPFALCDSSLKSADERAALRVFVQHIIMLSTLIPTLKNVQTMQAARSAHVIMTESAVAKRRGMPPGEEVPKGMMADEPMVVGRYEALDFLGALPSTIDAHHVVVKYDSHLSLRVPRNTRMPRNTHAI